MTKWWKSLSKIGGLIGLSKLLGAMRDLVVSAYFGTNYIADAFNYASLLTNYPFILLGGLNGPFHSAIIARISEFPPQDNSKKNIFLSKIIFWTFIVFSLLSLLGLFTAPFIINYFFADNVLLSNSIILQTNIMMPCLMVTGLIGVLFGISCHQGNYFLPSISPVLTSISTILIIIIFWGKISAGILLALGMIFGVLFQVFFQFIAIYQRDFRFVFSADFFNFRDIQLINYNYMLFPALLSSTIGSINIYIDTIFCNKLIEGSWTAILLGNRLIQLPFGILVGGALVAFLPSIKSLFSKIQNSSAENYQENTNIFKNKIFDEIFNLALILIPISMIFLAMAQPIVRIILERGAFNHSSTLLVSSVLFYLALSLITSLPREVFTRVFYGMNNSKIPFIISLVSIFFNFVFDYFLVKSLAVGGIALSTTLTSLCNSVLLFICLRQYIIIKWQKFIGLIIGALLCYFSAVYFFRILDNLHFFWQSAIACALSLSIYLFYWGILYFRDKKSIF